MTYDLLQRRLEDLGHEVRLVRNITDVDDPIFKRATELGLDYTQLASEETASFQSVMELLHFRPAYAEPLASSYIDQMAAAVQKLLDVGVAYSLEDDIYFDVSSDPAFGTFSGFSERLQLAFMKRRGGDPARPGKRAPLDFLLWHGVTDPADPAVWESVVGRGRPGWHIECSVMAHELLGTPFDIHGGGDDLIFPHHECEVAQSKALGQPQLAKHWMHVAPLLYLGEKMSKSLGNLIFAKDLLDNHAPNVIRLALLRYHYRTGGEWQPEFLEEAAELHAGLQKALLTCSESAASELLESIRRALDDDLDTHQIYHALHNFAASAQPAVPDAKHYCSPAKTALNLLGLG
ncbi:MAG: cysteinyl-tRNA synthetase [Candidatus Saccharibacteria bacterium]|nr:cysteinyl-tRNA synthetase [Candidatus Saccharibacteria bacterium]